MWSPQQREDLAEGSVPFARMAQPLSASVMRSKVQEAEYFKFPLAARETRRRLAAPGDFAISHVLSLILVEAVLDPDRPLQ
jgi:hypothetical protein